MIQNILKLSVLAFLLSHNGSLFAKSLNTSKVVQKPIVLAHAGNVKIQSEACGEEGYPCNYVLYDAKGKKKILLEDWSYTANAYQFTPNLMGFLFGATGSGRLLTVIDAENKQKDYANVEGINDSQSCMVTFESGLKNMPDSLVFYSLPDFRVHLVLNKKVPQFKKFTSPAGSHFEDNGDFSFDYAYPIENESGIQAVLIQNPCQKNYRIIMD